jgi:(p)ppGpp synthase/HD superfamily hydrolase
MKKVLYLDMDNVLVDFSSGLAKVDDATKAHRGVRDKAGAPYILHPLRVMNSLEGEDERMVAVLHDVLEDCEHSPWPDLVRRKLEPRLLRSLEAVTKTPEEEGSGDYMAFVRRLSPDSVARHVKLADLRDNLDVRRMPVVEERDRIRINKYLGAYRWLLAVDAAAGSDGTRKEES